MLKPQYKDLKFKSDEAFKKWLKEKTKYIVGFNSDDFDPTEWHLDERGEVLHSNLQSAVWNGKMVDVNYLIGGLGIRFSDGNFLKHKPVTFEAV